MKKASDPRHLKRRQIVKELFAESFLKQPATAYTIKIYNKREIIDKKIEKAAPQWPINKLNKIDLSILRLAVFELEEEKEPQKVVVDEAVELAKEFGSENTPGFVNGVLGKIISEK